MIFNFSIQVYMTFFLVYKYKDFEYKFVPSQLYILISSTKIMKKNPNDIYEIKWDIIMLGSL